jgi:hypothetical protein
MNGICDGPKEVKCVTGFIVDQPSKLGKKGNK